MTLNGVPDHNWMYCQQSINTEIFKGLTAFQDCEQRHPEFFYHLKI